MIIICFLSWNLLHLLANNNYMKKTYLLLSSLFTLSFSFAQQGETKGVTVTGIRGITKSLSDVIAHEKAHPLPPNFVATLRPELEGPEPVGQDPRAIQGARYGTLVSPAAAATISSVSSSTSQPAFSNFLAIWGSYANVSGRESPYTPPDNCGDVGFTQVIATANTRMKVFTKPTVTGTPSTTPTGSSTTTLSAVLNLNLNSFFANSSLGISGISDPHVRFDRLSGRWFIVAIDVNHSTNNYCCVAVSNGEHLTSSSNFTIFYFKVSQTGGSSMDFFDYPTLGVDNKSLYIGGNMFKSGRSFSGCNMWVVNKANLIAGTLTVTGFPQTLTKTDMYTPQGVHNDYSSSSYGYFIGASQTYYSKLVIRRVSYSGTTPSLSGDLNLSTLAIYTPKTVPTLNGTSIDGGDRRLYAAMIKKNKYSGLSSLWVAQGTKLNSSGVGGSTGDRDGALWLEIGSLSTAPVISQSAMLYDGVHATSSAVYYTYPTIATNGQGHSLMGFTSAGPAKYCQAAAANRYRTDAPATFNIPGDFTTSGTSYNPGASRWGDYTQTVVDPADNMTMWTFSEYTATTNSWGVRAAQFKAPPPAKPSLASTPPCGTSTVTINGTSTNHSEYFDPGTGYIKRVGVSVSGPGTITVSNIVFVSPTKITATFNTSGAPAGTYIVTIKNPDGQVASTSFSLANCTLATVSTNPGISENIEASKTIIYPNPVHDILTIVNVKGVNSVIQIFDNNGILLRQTRTSLASYKINVSNLAAGTYMLKISSDNKVEVQKFVKE